MVYTNRHMHHLADPKKKWKRVLQKWKKIFYLFLTRTIGVLVLLKLELMVLVAILRKARSLYFSMFFAYNQVPTFYKKDVGVVGGVSGLTVVSKQAVARFRVARAVFWKTAVILMIFFIIYKLFLRKIMRERAKRVYGKIGAYKQRIFFFLFDNFFYLFYKKIERTTMKVQFVFLVLFFGLQLYDGIILIYQGEFLYNYGGFFHLVHVSFLGRLGVFLVAGITVIVIVCIMISKLIFRNLIIDTEKTLSEKILKNNGNQLLATMKVQFVFLVLFVGLQLYDIIIFIYQGECLYNYSRFFQLVHVSFRGRLGVFVVAGITVIVIVGIMLYQLYKLVLRDLIIDTEKTLSEKILKNNGNQLLATMKVQFLFLVLFVGLQLYDIIIFIYQGEFLYNCLYNFFYNYRGFSKFGRVSFLGRLGAGITVIVIVGILLYKLFFRDLLIDTEKTLSEKILKNNGNQLLFVFLKNEEETVVQVIVLIILDLLHFYECKIWGYAIYFPHGYLNKPSRFMNPMILLRRGGFVFWQGAVIFMMLIIIYKLAFRKSAREELLDSEIGVYLTNRKN